MNNITSGKRRTRLNHAHANPGQGRGRPSLGVSLVPQHRLIGRTPWDGMGGPSRGEDPPPLRCHVTLISMENNKKNIAKKSTPVSRFRSIYQTIHFLDISKKQQRCLIVCPSCRAVGEGCLGLIEKRAPGRAPVRRGLRLGAGAHPEGKGTADPPARHPGARTDDSRVVSGSELWER